MIKRLLLLGATVAVALLTGCASTRPMALQEGEKITPESNPIYLVSVAIRNNYKDSYQPAIQWVEMEQKGERMPFMVDERTDYPPLAGGKGTGALLRMQFEPGSYTLRGLYATINTFLIRATYFIPIHAPIDVNARGVYYLGHVKATLRERKGEEFKAGPSIPAIDQAVAGASGGSWDIEIVDRFDADEKIFRSRFPALAGKPIQKRILPPFNRAVAQKWWEDN